MTVGPKQYAFFDASVFLSLYQFPPKDLEGLGKLAELIDAGQLVVLLPSQVEDEYRRRRAKVVADVLKTLREANLQVALPAMARGTDAFATLAAAMDSARKAREDLAERLLAEAADRCLPADAFLKRLFRKATSLDCSTVIDAAETRHALGNPPGKKDSLGDAVNWEALLRYGPDNHDLSLVTSDADFASPLDRQQPDEFLAREWLETKGGELILFRGLDGFMDARFPNVRLVTDLRKHLMIEEFLASGSFNETHALIPRLERYAPFTVDEVQRLLVGGLENNQIRWLARDPDVHRFLSRLLSGHRKDLPALLAAKWDILMSDGASSYGSAPTDEEAEASLVGPHNSD